MKHIYFTSCANDGGIYHYTFHNKKLTFKEKTNLEFPMYSVINNKKMYILLRCTDKDTGFGGLITFDINDDGQLCNASGIKSSQGIVPCHLCVNDNSVYLVNYLSGNLVKLPDKVVTHSGKGTHPTRQDSPHTHFVTASPDNKFILCTDLGLDTIFVYNSNLELVSSAKVPLGSGCRHLCFGKNGDYLYCVNELSNDVSVFSFKLGQLSLINTYSAIPDFKGKSTAAAIRIVGNYLYISHRGADCITRFQINEDKLIFLENTPCGGKNPRDFDICDDCLFCANEGGNITRMKLVDGKPVLIGEVFQAEDPLCVTIN